MNELHLLYFRKQKEQNKKYVSFRFTNGVTTKDIGIIVMPTKIILGKLIKNV